MAEILRKVNFLLSQRTITAEHIRILNWLSENLSNLSILTQVVELLKEQGLTLKDFVNQINYGNEFRLLQLFYTDFRRQTEYNYVGTEIGTFIFEGKMIPALATNLSNVVDDLPYLKLKDFSTGLLIIPLDVVTIRNLNEDLYFTSTSDAVKIEIIQNETGPEISFIFEDDIFILQGRDSTILNMTQLNRVIQQRIIMLPYYVDGDTVTIHNMEAVIDVDKTEVMLSHSNNKIVMQWESFITMVSDLPIGVKMSLNAITEQIDPVYKQVYITSLIQEMLPQAKLFYANTYGDSLSAGLYGQGTAVAISQLYTLANSTLRREEVSYNRTVPFSVTETPVQRDSTFEVNKFRMETPFSPGTVWGLQTNTTWGLTWHWTEHPISMELIDTENERAIISTILSTQRITTPKIPISKVTSIGTSTTMTWFEERYSNVSSVNLANTVIQVRSMQTNAILDPNDWKLNGIAGGSLTGSTGELRFHGLNLLVHNRIGVSSVFQLEIIRTYLLTSTKQIYFVMVPDDLASDSTNTFDANINWTSNGNSHNTRTRMSRQRIEYGEEERQAYVGLVRTENTSSTLSVTSTLRFDSVSSSLLGGLEFPSNALADQFARRSHKTSSFDCVENVVSIPFGRITNDTYPQLALPGSCENSIQNRIMGFFITSPPHAWQDWGTGGITTEYTSCYLSVSSQLQSQQPSPLVMQNSSASVNLISNNGSRVPSDVWGWQLGASQPFHWTSTLDTATLVRTSEFSPILGLAHNINNTSSSYTLERFSGRVIELLLPEGIYNQHSIAESTVNNRLAIALLVQYANYLNFLIENLTERVSVVESTMANVIDAINMILETLNPQVTVGAQLLNFIGTSVGMFFPLTGLAINIAGQLWSGVAHIQDGNLLIGSMDIVTGSLMSILGIRKFQQRMDRKYGATDVVLPPPSPPSRLPTYDELFGKPGYNAVGTSIAPKNSVPIKPSSGVLKSANITYRDQKTIVETILYQQGLYNAYSNRRSLERTGVIIEVIETWDDIAQFESITYEMYSITHNLDYDIEKHIITDSEFAAVHGTKINKQLYMKYLFCYANIGNNVSETLSYDPEIMHLYVISNLSTSTYQANRNLKASPVIYYEKCNSENITKLLRTDNETRTAMSVTDFADAMDPYVTSQDERKRLLDNVYSYASNM